MTVGPVLFTFKDPSNEKTTTLLLIILLGMSQATYAGVLGHGPKGEGYAGLTFYYLGYNRYYGADGSVSTLEET